MRTSGHQLNYSTVDITPKTKKRPGEMMIWPDYQSS